MSPDHLFHFLFRPFDFFRTPEKAEIAIEKRFIATPGATVLKVIIPPWGNGESIVTKILARRLQKAGYACLIYSFPKYLLSTDPKNTLRFFTAIRAQVLADIGQYKSAHSFQRIDLIAASLGVVSACLIANENVDITNLYFIVPGSSLASSLWHGIRTGDLRKAYVHQRFTEQSLVELWAGLAPKKNIDAMQGKHIFITISKADIVIPYRFGQELVDVLHTLYPEDVETEVTRFSGHYLGIISYFVFSKTLLQ